MQFVALSTRKTEIAIVGLMTGRKIVAEKVRTPYNGALPLNSFLELIHPPFSCIALEPAAGFMGRGSSKTFAVLIAENAT
jgi:hypothetical protein